MLYFTSWRLSSSMMLITMVGYGGDKDGWICVVDGHMCLRPPPTPLFVPAPSWTQTTGVSRRAPPTHFVDQTQVFRSFGRVRGLRFAVFHEVVQILLEKLAHSTVRSWSGNLSPVRETGFYSNSEKVASSQWFPSFGLKIFGPFFGRIVLKIPFQKS